MRLLAISAAALAVLWLATSGHHGADSTAASRQGQSALHTTADFRSSILAQQRPPSGERLDPDAALRNRAAASPTPTAASFSAEAPWAAEAEFAPPDR